MLKLRKTILIRDQDSGNSFDDSYWNGKDFELNKILLMFWLRNTVPC